ncbi:MAG: class I SAM-dependent methyltransferase [Proteobacteria bacterium]|nr:class I SAM-dependent methyltransferase [Pseudomonadota bacterium]
MVNNCKILLIFAACLINVRSETFTYQQAIKECDALNLKIQKPEADGRVQTLNKKGAVTARFAYIEREFLKFGKGKEILEIGGCYGDVMLHALKQSTTTQYVLSDLDRRHLFIAAKKLAEKIQKNWLKSDSVNQVKFVEADITNADHVKNFEQYEAILIARVLHFCTPEQLELTVKHLFLLLKPGGRVFVIAITPYVKRFQKFIPEYERRVKAGEKYPGFVKSLREYVDADVTTLAQIKNIHEDPFLFLDVNTLRETFEQNGFKILECRTIPLNYKSTSWNYDGRENVILIAQKKKVV